MLPFARRNMQRAGGSEGGSGMYAFRIPVGSFLRASLMLAATAGTCAASSLIALPDEAGPDALPSVISRGQVEPPPLEAWQPETAAGPDGAGEVLTLGSSVIAFGTDAIPVSRDEVASIPDDEKPSPETLAETMPLALRGSGDGDGLISLAD